MKMSKADDSTERVSAQGRTRGLSTQAAQSLILTHTCVQLFACGPDGLEPVSVDPSLDRSEAQTTTQALSAAVLDDVMYRFRHVSIPGASLYVFEAEANAIEANLGHSWTRRQAVFKVSATPASGLVDFVRFRNATSGTYLYAGPEESESIRANFADTFIEEGYAFSAPSVPPPGLPIPGTQPFIRYQSVDTPGAYIYNASLRSPTLLSDSSFQAVPAPGLGVWELDGRPCRRNNDSELPDCSFISEGLLCPAVGARCAWTVGKCTSSEFSGAGFALRTYACRRLE